MLGSECGVLRDLRCGHTKSKRCLHDPSAPSCTQERASDVRSSRHSAFSTAVVPSTRSPSSPFTSDHSALVCRVVSFSCSANSASCVRSEAYNVQVTFVLRDLSRSSRNNKTATSSISMLRRSMLTTSSNEHMLIRTLAARLVHVHVARRDETQERSHACACDSRRSCARASSARASSHIGVQDDVYPFGSVVLPAQSSIGTEHLQQRERCRCRCCPSLDGLTWHSHSHTRMNDMDEIDPEQSQHAHMHTKAHSEHLVQHKSTKRGNKQHDVVLPLALAHTFAHLLAKCSRRRPELRASSFEQQANDSGGTQLIIDTGTNDASVVVRHCRALQLYLE